MCGGKVWSWGLELMFGCKVDEVGYGVVRGKWVGEEE